MTRAAAMQNAKYPRLALTPISTAPAAPGNPTTARVWPAKVWRRSTMNQPIGAATTATIGAGHEGVDHEPVLEQLARCPRPGSS